jgi:hypothetical protein
MSASLTTTRTDPLRKQLAKPPPSGLGRKFLHDELIDAVMGVEAAAASFRERKRSQLTAKSVKVVHGFLTTVEKLSGYLHDEAILDLTAAAWERRHSGGAPSPIQQDVDLQMVASQMAEDARRALENHQRIKNGPPPYRILIGELAEVGISALGLPPQVSMSSGNSAPLACFTIAACWVSKIDVPQYFTVVDYIHRDRRERGKKV